MKRIIVASLLGGLLCTNTGCCVLQSLCCYRPCVARGSCGGCCDGDCDEGCGPSCGPVHRPIRNAICRARCARGGECCDGGCDGDCGRPCGRFCGPACGRACDTGCDPCGDPCGECGCGRCWNRGPLTWIFALLAPPCWCGRGCGERYWGDFYGDPPDCWDPCDCYGNYTGGGHVVGGGRVHGGCRSCGGGGGGEVVDGEVYSEGPAPNGRSVVSQQRMAVPQGGKILSQTDRAVDSSDSPSDGPADGPAQQPHRASK